MTPQGGDAQPVTQPSNINRGAWLLIAAAAIFTGEVVVVRFIADAAGIGQIVAVRAGIQLVIAAVWIIIRNPDLFKSNRIGMHIARGLASLICWWLYYRSFQLLDLALATTLTFTTSLFVVAFAAPVLREKVGLHRWVMTVLGFTGVVVASGMTGFTLAPGVYFGLASAAAAAVLVFLNRMLARSEATITIMFYIGIVTFVGTVPGAVLTWQPLELQTLGLMALSGALGTIGMFATIEAYRVGEVSALAPYPYMRLVFAAVAGFLLFSEVPALHVIAGSAIIVGCSLEVNRRERRRGLG